MTCICARKLEDLAKALLPLEPAPVDLPAPLTKLMSVPLAPPPSPQVKAQLKALAGLNLPPLALSPLTLAQLSAVSQSVETTRGAMGIDLLQPGASAKLSASIGAFNANLPALMPLCDLDPWPWLPLSSLASLVMSLKNAFGVNILAPGALGSLNLALQAVASNPPPPAPAEAMPYASLAQVASTLNVDLAKPNAMATLGARADMVAKLAIPPITLSPAAMVGPVMMMTSIANIIAGLGLLPGAPEFPQQVLTLNTSLAQFEDLTVPAGLAGAAPVAPVLPHLGLDFKALAALDVSPLQGFQAPNLGPLMGMASLAEQCNAAGSPVTSQSACGPGCPLGVSSGAVSL